MREVLFRGKPIVCKELMEPNETLKGFFKRQYDWSDYSVNKAFTDDGFVIGQVVYSHGKAWIVGEVVEAGEDYIALEYWVPVKPETVGEYTGLKDKNGIKIFEGDMPGGTWEGLVIGWCDKCASFQLFTPDGECLACLGDVTWSDFVGDVHEGVVEVIDNLHDNPELLEVK